MAAELSSTPGSISAKNEEGKKVIAALKIFVNQIDTKTLIDLSKLIEKEPSLISKAMKYKGFIGL